MRAAAGGARLRRALFNVPGSDARKLAKVKALSRFNDQILESPRSPIGLDAVVLDLEDGVAANSKEKARSLVRQQLEEEADRDAKQAKSSHDHEVLFASVQTERLIRVNAAESGLLELDVRECVAPACEAVHRLRTQRRARGDPLPPPLSVVLTKVNSANDVGQVLDLVRKHVSIKAAAEEMTVLAAVETARGMRSLDEIACAGNGQLSGLVFASEDLCADMGMTRTADASELLFFRSSVVMHSVANEIDAIDMVCLNFKDYSVIREEAKTGSNMGFTGKQAIHPFQITPILDGFQPEASQLRLAREIIAGFREHSLRGKGAFEIDGNMIDLPMVKWAKKILARSGEEHLEEH